MPRQNKIRVIARNSNKAAYFRETLNRVPGVWPVPVIVNFGSMKPHPTFRGIIINPHDSVMRSSDKYGAKESWEMFGEEGLPRHSLPYAKLGIYYRDGAWSMNGLQRCFGERKLIVKPRRGSGGRGIKVVNSYRDLPGLRIGDKDKYLVEAYMEFNQEYRIFVAPALAGIEMSYRLRVSGESEFSYTRSNGSFFEIRKRVKAGFDLQTRNIAENPDAVYFSRDFTRPSCWELIIYNAVKAAELVGLDFAAVDVVYNTETRDFIICEVNSNPGIDLTKNGGRPLSAQALEIAIIKIITLKCVELRQQ